MNKEHDEQLTGDRNYSLCVNYFLGVVNIYFSVPPVRRYVSQDGFDTDQCGQTTESACKTMTPILEQLHTLNSFVSPDLLDQVEDIWRDVFDQFQSIFDQVEEWRNGPPPPPVQTLSTTSTIIKTEPWITRYVFLENYPDQCKFKE